MAVATAPAQEERRSPSKEVPVSQAPLLWLALAVTLGAIFDRYWEPAPELSLAAAVAGLVLWRLRQATIAYMLLAAGAVACAYHHVAIHIVSPGDISFTAQGEYVPCRVRGIIASAPRMQPMASDPLRSLPPQEITEFTLRISEQQDITRHTWSAASGLVQVRLVGPCPLLAIGDQVDVLGRLSVPESPANPGELDLSARFRDRGVAATLTIGNSDSIEVLRRDWYVPVWAWPARVRGWGEEVLAGALSRKQWPLASALFFGDEEPGATAPARSSIAPLAAALLLGEDRGMTRSDWERFQNTGVIHVISISGQHLVVLGWFTWGCLRLAGWRRRTAAPLVALLLVSYAIITGARPPGMRSACMAAALCVGIVIRRPTQPTNLLALAWIGVFIINPADLFNTGCQLSFIAVAVLTWGATRWHWPVPDPVEQVVADVRPRSLHLLYQILRAICWGYAINAAVWLAVTPLAAARYHVVAPIALLIGPPLTLLTSFALLAGFVLLLMAPWSLTLAWAPAAATQVSLTLCSYVAQLGADWPGAFFHVADVPEWWLWIFYLGLLTCLAARSLGRLARPILAVGIAWFGLAVTMQLWPHRPGEFRCAFLAVGHGGCTVIESPGGQVFLYDVGSLVGPAVVRRTIAPYLWQRGIRRIDEVLISHADLDHFNGMVELAKRVTVRKVRITPSFPERDLPKEVMDRLKPYRMEYETVDAPSQWDRDGITFTVLHPPAKGPDGVENARSLVVLVQHRQLRLLLTGDLEAAGMERLLAMPAQHVDILQAPHHGSERSEPVRLSAWARPQLVISSQGPALGFRKTAAAYEERGAVFLSTWPHGAVTVRQDEAQAWVETYRTGFRATLRRERASP